MGPVGQGFVLLLARSRRQQHRISMALRLPSAPCSDVVVGKLVGVARSLLYYSLSILLSNTSVSKAK